MWKYTFAGRDFKEINIHLEVLFIVRIYKRIGIVAIVSLLLTKEQVFLRMCLLYFLFRKS